MWSPVDHLGRLLALSESAAEFFPEAGWQRCIVHFYRNIFSHVPSTKAREIAAMLKAIHAGEDIVAARQKAVQVIEKLRVRTRKRCPDAGTACGAWPQNTPPLIDTRGGR